MLFPVVRAYAPYCYRCPLGLRRETCRIDCLADLEARLKEGGDSIAGVLVEPMLQGAGGMIVWPPEFLSGARKLCDQYSTLLIADEVLTGFGRTGRMFACEHAAVRPDLVCMSKGLTAGYLPMGATAATDAIYQAFLSEDRGKSFFHGHSFTANPLACAVALASLDLFRENAVLNRIQALERQLQAGFEPLRSYGDVRVIGGVGILELASSAPGYLDQIGPRLYRAFLDRGLLLRPLGNVLYFMPPYVIKDAEVDWVLSQITEVLAEHAP
jgi:adenosylmethionine-8-amino-7-oxononanoate aminotransferase